MTTTTMPLTPDTLAAIIAADELRSLISDATAYRATIASFYTLDHMIHALLHDMRDNIIDLAPIFFETITDDTAIDDAQRAMLAMLSDARTHELICYAIERAL